MGPLGVGIREPQNNNAFNPFDPNSFDSLTKPKTDFNRAPGAPVRTQYAKNGPGAVNYLQKSVSGSSIAKPSLNYNGQNQQQTYLFNQQNSYLSSMSNSYSQSNYNQSAGSQHSSQTSSPADFRLQREQVLRRNQYEHAQASVRAQQENLQQLQLLQALYVQTQMQSQTGMSAHSRNDFQPYSQQIYGINSNSSNDQAKRSSSSSFSMRSEFPPRKSVFQEKINKHVGECLIIFNSLKRDLDFNIYKENLTSTEIYGELLNCVLPHLLSGYNQYPVPSDLSCKIFNAVQNCREAEEKDAIYCSDISMKYLCDALDMLSNQLHAVRNQLTFFTKSSF